MCVRREKKKKTTERLRLYVASLLYTQVELANLYLYSTTETHNRLGSACLLPFAVAQTIVAKERMRVPCCTTLSPTLINQKACSLIRDYLYLPSPWIPRKREVSVDHARARRTTKEPIDRQRHVFFFFFFLFRFAPGPLFFFFFPWPCRFRLGSKQSQPPPRLSKCHSVLEPLLPLQRTTFELDSGVSGHRAVV